jgi:hypothetical protein
MKDSFLNWQVSYNTYCQLSKNKLNKGKVNFYLCRHANHGDLPFIADYVPNSLL